MAILETIDLSKHFGGLVAVNNAFLGGLDGCEKYCPGGAAVNNIINGGGV